MSVDVGSGNKGGRKSVDAALNLVPFIDLMSVLIAFLLITAVWTNIAQMNVSQKGQGSMGAPEDPQEEPKKYVSVLIGPEDIKVGISDGEPVAFKRTAGEREGDYDPSGELRAGESGVFNLLAKKLEALRLTKKADGSLAFSRKCEDGEQPPANFPTCMRDDIEVAAQSNVNYQGVITTMDTALASGWKDVGFVPRASLTARVE